MATHLPSREQIDSAGDLDFEPQRSANQADISIEVAPDGLHVSVTYRGPLSSVKGAIERLRRSGIFEVVEVNRTTPAAAAARPGIQRRPPAQLVEPFFRADGQACCPTHRTPLNEGAFGLYCSAKAQEGEPANAKGYCSLRFRSSL